MNPFNASKLYWHLDSIGEWMLKGDAHPVTAELDLTNRCTDRCPHCAGGRRGVNDMPYALAERVIGELADFGVRGLILTGGGEPLLYERLDNVVDCALGHGLEVGLITNGVLLETQVYAAAKCKWVRVSLDGYDADSYRKSHGTEHFADVCRNIKLMAEQPKRGTLGVGYLVDKNTVHGIVRAAQLCSTLGVDYLQFRPFHHALHDPSWKEDWKKAWDAAQSFSNDTFRVVCSANKFDAYLNDSVLRRPWRECYGHCMACVVAADGKMYLCCHMRGKERYVLGDLNKTHLSEIWDSSLRAHVTMNINRADCPPMCRCDPMNCILDGLKNHTPEHVNFL